MLVIFGFFCSFPLPTASCQLAMASSERYFVLSYHIHQDKEVTFFVRDIAKNKTKVCRYFSVFFCGRQALISSHSFPDAQNGLSQLDRVHGHRLRPDPRDPRRVEAGRPHHRLGGRRAPAQTLLSPDGLRAEPRGVRERDLHQGELPLPNADMEKIFRRITHMRKKKY